jgi:microcystin degradation protein MlrC
LIPALKGTSVPSAGAIAAAEASGVQLVPLTWCFANPAGPIEDEAFERIAALLVAGLARALDEGPLDGVYLDLHGAAVVVSHADAEGELLRRVRAVIGATPLTISLDPHANLTRRMVDLADAIAPFRTYPHVDMPDAGARAFNLLVERIRRGEPWARSFRQLDYWIAITSQCTLSEPMAPVMAERARLEAVHGARELALCFGFPYADFADCGVAVAAYADDQSKADAAADALHGELVRREATFALDVVPAAAAVGEAIRLSNSARRPVVIADTQDNPGGGGHGDTTGLLAELIKQNAQGAVLAIINDAESAEACHRAGAGARIALSLGGKSDGVPLPVEAVVEALGDGDFVYTGPMGKGNPANLGAMALIQVAPGVRVVVTSRKCQAYDQAILRHLGVEPAACKILALKSSVHFRADFQPIAERVIVAVAPGPVVADSSSLPFRNLRPGVRLKPKASSAR